MIPVKVIQWAGVAVAVVLAAAIAYMAGYSPFSQPGQPGGGEPAAVAGRQTEAAPATPEAGTGDASSSQAPGTTAPAAAPESAAQQPARDMAAAPQVVTPSFGIVRVEPDGSLVVAGSAGAEAGVELISGTRKLGETKATLSGDFAIVLDEPLKPGDYQLVLRATETDGRAATSLETAIVAVPETADGQVLALVEEPGKPSRLITTPAPADTPSGTPAGAPATGQGGAPAPQDNAAPAAEGTGQTDGAPAGEAAAAPESGSSGGVPAASGEASEGAETAPAGDAGAATAAAGKADEANEDVAAPSGQETAPAVAAGEPSGVEQPEAGVETAMADPAAGRETATPGTDGGDAAAEPAQTPPVSAPASAAGKPSVLVEAVEIEGRRIFVAGAASGGERVRVYANDILLGDAPVTDGGRFLVEATRDLPVGDYIVRADLLAANNADVIARAAVPFQRSEGEAIAAVAPAAPRETEPRQQTASPDSAGGATPAGPAQGGDGAAAGAAATQTPATGQAAGAAGSEGQPGGQLANAGGGQQDSGQVSASQAMTATAPALEATQGSVIIRRGDTLWQISRRVYGRGVRYSTIYLANQEQIADPDRIWPGQVFRVPGETPEGEAADMSTVETPPEDGAEDSGGK
ncbi:LysM peptidoglycan-binding domain-containing protein [Zhengella sp. ZM62]|uniref:LysM peptidoglycan-binding domain-containing protein n=1 Tax=Zhengella sedimenti TaxID=3390035 RepID=UPI003975F557